ncbi:MAG: prepilin-type N-terminal cleavage/methylation domain-containing protein, partial [bacterium]|nr:prepilin-type N-terminal cleavage/methylation domain-containing protein [bacterium]
MKDKGFTLIELLAVIVILAIIALIAVPIII